MIPTTLTGVLLLLVLVLPGFIYVVLRERHRPARKASVFRETSTVLTASGAAYLLPFICLLVVTAANPGARSNLVTFLQGAASYEHAHPLRLFATALIFVVAAIGLAVLLAAPWFPRVFGLETGGSAWWSVFGSEFAAAELDRQVSVSIDDGTVITGILHSWNRDADDHLDRDLVLREPLWIQNPGSDQVESLAGATLVLSARVIKFISVSYLSGLPASPIGATEMTTRNAAQP